MKRPKLTAADRFLWAGELSAVWEAWQPSAVIMAPATVIGWHRKGFGLFWSWKIRRGRPGRPAVPADVRSLIRAMSRDNPLWGAPRIHNELLKLGIALGESSVSAWTTQLCSANGACTVTCKVSWTNIIGAGPTWDWRRTHRNLAPSNRRTWGGLLRCRNSADSIIVTSAALHKGIFGAIPSALLASVLARPY